MIDLMKSIYEYLSESCLKEYLPWEYYWHYQRVLEATERALTDTLSPEQWNLLEKLTETTVICHDMELEAMFRAAWQAARELA